MENPIRKRLVAPALGLALALTATVTAAADETVPALLPGATPAGDLAGFAALPGGAGVNLADIAVAISVNALDQYTVQTMGIGTAVSGVAIRGADVAIGDGNLVIGSAISINTGFNAQQGAMSAFSFASGGGGGGSN